MNKQRTIAETYITTTKAKIKGKEEKKKTAAKTVLKRIRNESKREKHRLPAEDLGSRINIGINHLFASKISILGEINGD